MATINADDEVPANVIPLTRRSERAQAQLFAKALRNDIASMTRKITKAESAWERRCESGGYVDPPKRLVIVRDRLSEARRMLNALNARFPRGWVD
jgi:predicted transcriptional regulator